MDMTYPPPVFSEVLDFIVSSPSPEEIIAYKPSETLEARLRDLLQKNKEGTLSQEEQAELDGFMSLNHFMNMLKIRARQKLTNHE